MAAATKVIPWGGRTSRIQDRPSIEAVSPVSRSGPARRNGDPDQPCFGPLEDNVIFIGDGELEALGSIFCKSPLRRAMTFEGYLAVKGYGGEPR